jgi:general secretion pathway protein H
MAIAKLVTGMSMKIAPPRNNKSLTQPAMLNIDMAGFTLIELLIVIVIISVVSSVALLSISHNQHKNIENFAHQLAQVITLAEHEAMLRPATLGLGFTTQHYQFYKYKSTWQPLTDKNLGQHSIPNKIQLSLQMNDKTIPADGKPAIVIAASGDITPFTILLGEPDKQPIYQISGEANGNIKCEPFHEEK